MCIIEYTTFRFCRHREVYTWPCRVGVCINELFLDLPDYSKQIRHVVSTTHNVYAACCRADLDRNTPPPQTRNIQPVQRSPKYILRRAQTKRLPDIGLGVRLTFTVVESADADYRDGVELMVRTGLPFVEAKSLGDENKSCCICLHDYISEDGTTNEQVVRLGCGHFLGSECIRLMVRNLDRANKMVKEPRLCMRCPLCREGMFEELEEEGEEVGPR